MLLFAGLFAVLSWGVLHRRPVRGDIFLAFEVASAIALTYLHQYYTSHREPFKVSFLWSLQFTALHLLYLSTITTIYRLSPFHPLYKFPGPFYYKISSLAYATLVASGWRHQVIRRLHKIYGPILRIGPNSLSINSKNAISLVYGSSKCLDRSDAYLVQTLPGDGLFFVTDRNIHHERRTLWASAFTSTNLEKYQPIMQNRTDQLAECIVSRMNEKGQVNLSEALEHWSYDFMGDFAFGDASPLELMRDGDATGWVPNGKWATALFDILGVVPWLLDILWYLPFTASMRDLHQQAARLVKQHENKANHSCDILSYLCDESVKPQLSNDEKIMDAIFAIQAGSDTSANVLQYTFFFVISNPDVRRKLQEELDTTFPEPNQPLDFQILANLPYLNAVINEGLRLGTPLSGLDRITPAEGAVIDGTYVPGGTIVSIPAFTQQMEERNFSPHPDQFMPLRWLPEGRKMGMTADINAVMSFSFGPYGCIGRGLAMQELRLVLAVLFLRFDITPPKGFDPEDYRRKIRNIRTTFFPTPLTACISSRT